jgi:hypothetical protein
MYRLGGLVGAREDGLVAVRKVEVEVSWLMEMAASGEDDDGEDHHLRYEPLGVVVFERIGLDRCRTCLRGSDSRRHRECCSHVGLKTDIVVGEMEAERTEGMEKLLAAELVTTRELRETRRSWTLGT